MVERLKVIPILKNVDPHLRSSCHSSLSECDQGSVYEQVSVRARVIASEYGLVTVHWPITQPETGGRDQVYAYPTLVVVCHFDQVHRPKQSGQVYKPYLLLELTLPQTLTFRMRNSLLLVVTI